MKPVVGKAIRALGLVPILASGTMASADPGLAFVSIRDGNPHIYLKEGEAERQLTHGAGGNQQPVWSPDGQRIAFTSTREGLMKVFLMGANGGDQVRVTTDSRVEFAPSWSPDGRSLAFYSMDPAQGLTELIIIELASGARVVVKGNGRGKGPFPATWSSDGKRLAFNGDDASVSPKVWVVERDGSNAREVGRDFNQRRKASAAISPDGRIVAYVADMRNGIDLVFTDLETGTSRNMTATGRAANHEGPVWSPDGQRIAFASSRDDEQLLRTDVFVMNRDGSGMRNLSNHPHEDYHPRWSVDGRTVYFTSLRTGAARIYGVDVESGRSVAVTAGTSHDMDPAPRPADRSLRATFARLLLGR